MSFKDRCWTEIDRSVLRENLRILQSRIPDGCRLMGIVKADGYGHGAAEVAALFADVPGSWLGVACLQEALDLRRAGIALPILILGYTPPHQAAVLAENRLTQALLSPEYTCRLAQEARRQGVRVMAHAAVDTGMGRIGYAACDPDEAARALAADYRRAELEVTGIFTHFSSAYAQTEDARAYTRGQFEKFSAVCGELRRLGVDPGLRHCANSPATVNCPEYAMDLCRVGTVLYGLLPPTAATCPLPLRPALTWKARVAHPPGRGHRRRRRRLLPPAFQPGKGEDPGPCVPGAGPGVHGHVHGGHHRLPRRAGRRRGRFAGRQGRGRRALPVALSAHRHRSQRRHLQHPAPGGAHLPGRITDE